MQQAKFKLKPVTYSYRVVINSIRLQYEWNVLNIKYEKSKLRPITRISFPIRDNKNLA